MRLTTGLHGQLQGKVLECKQVKILWNCHSLSSGKSILGDLFMKLYQCNTFWKKSFPIFDKCVPFKETAPAQIYCQPADMLGGAWEAISYFLQLPFCICWPGFSSSGKCFRLYREIDMVLGHLPNGDVQPVEFGWLGFQKCKPHLLVAEAAMRALEKDTVKRSSPQSASPSSSSGKALWISQPQVRGMYFN